jgi:hypothetical protein
LPDQVDIENEKLVPLLINHYWFAGWLGDQSKSVPIYGTAGSKPYSNA